MPSTPLDIVTILRSGALGRGSGRACGYAAGSKHQVGGSIVVSVPCVAAFALGLSRSDFGWRHPRLAIPRHDDLVGAVIAHEIAHLLGVGHAASGVMRSGLHHDDVVALRAGKLAFERQEVMALRMGLAAASAPRTASRHP